MRSRRAGFAVVTGGYLATTTAEATLAPAFPLVARELDLGPGFAGFAFGVLAAAIALGSLVGGVVLARLGPRAGLAPGVGLVAAGSAWTAAAGGTVTLLAGQVVLGFGSGLFFASGLRSAAVFAGYRRRGRAMGLFGVAFSAGLALGGALAALGEIWGWRTSFVAAAVIAAVSATALALVRVPEEESGPREATSASRLREAFGVPVAVGGVAAASQYGTIGFFVLYAVERVGQRRRAAHGTTPRARAGRARGVLDASAWTGALRLGRPAVHRVRQRARPDRERPGARAARAPR